MMYKVFLAALAASPLVAAHGKVSVVQGDAGGNGTALGIKGGVVPGPGRNSVTEVDTTVFRSTNIATDGLGRTTGSGKNTVAMAASAMAQSGNTLPQVSANGGSISGTLHVVTTDGAGPFKAMVDSTAAGSFANGAVAEVATQVPGRGGNISPSGKVRGAARRWMMSRGLYKRAANVNKDYPIKVNIPAGTTCTGTYGGQSNVCLLKIANANPAGPFGGVVAFQMAGASAAAPAAAAPAAAAPAAADGEGAADAGAEDAGAAAAGAGAGAAAGAAGAKKAGAKGAKGAKAGAKAAKGAKGAKAAKGAAAEE